VTVFLLLGVAGLAVLALSLVVGDLFGGALDALAGDAFSSAVLGGFVSALGFGSALAQALGAPLGLAVVVGVVAGLLLGWLASWLTRVVRGSASDDTLVADDVLGREGRVVIEVPDGGYGTVQVLVGGHVVRLNARAEVPMTAGTPVHVTSVLSPTAVTVAPL